MSSPSRVTITRVIDGDTVDVITQAGFLKRSQKLRLRLYGIDAPESKQKGGAEATKHLRKIIGSGKNILMETTGTDQYGRSIALIYNSKAGRANSFNHTMVRDGQARSYMATGADRSSFSQAEQTAKANRLGIWKPSTATAPWEWRQSQRRRQRTKSKIIFIILAIAVIALIAIAASPLCTRITQYVP